MESPSINGGLKSGRLGIVVRAHALLTLLPLLSSKGLDFAKAERIAPRAFLVFQTSPANYQVL